MAASGFCVFETAIGTCGIAWGENGLAGVQLPQADAAGTRARMRHRFPLVDEMAPPPEVTVTIERIGALLRGERDDLRDVVLDMRDVPPFHRKVYAAARAIPPGRTLTYGEVAAEIGEPGASRAVGHALGHNPFAPVVPCHRVLAAGNRSGGFSAAGGVATKLRMLRMEGARIGAEPGLFDDAPADDEPAAPR
jgi:methylated-DNA-[protein]-cysteine S-methyltransferase